MSEMCNLLSCIGLAPHWHGGNGVEYAPRTAPSESKKMTAEQRANKIAEICILALPKKPDISLIASHITQACDEARAEMFTQTYWGPRLKEAYEKGFSDCRAKLEKIVPNYPEFNMLATITYLDLLKIIRALQPDLEGK